MTHFLRGLFIGLCLTLAVSPAIMLTGTFAYLDAKRQGGESIHVNKHHLARG